MKSGSERGRFFIALQYAAAIAILFNGHFTGKIKIAGIKPPRMSDIRGGLFTQTVANIPISA
jgi:hypothetical protein